MVILYSSHPEVIQSWQSALKSEEIHICHHEKALLSLLQTVTSNVVLLLEERHYDDDGMERFSRFVANRISLCKNNGL